MAPRRWYLRSRAIDRLSTLPPELLLMITYLPPQISNPVPPPLLEYPEFLLPVRPHRQFLGHSSVLAPSRTCKHLHGMLTPELIKDLLAAEESDTLGFAVERVHIGLAVKLLEAKHVEATEGRLLRWIENRPLYQGEWRAKEKIVEALVELGAGKGLGRDWHSMMDLRKPQR